MLNRSEETKNKKEQKPSFNQILLFRAFFRNIIFTFPQQNQHLANTNSKSFYLFILGFHCLDPILGCSTRPLWFLSW
jgi:hypothetical protein